MEIPLNTTADLGVALKHTRAKRIAALLENFPSLNTKKKAPTEAGDAEAQDDDDDNNNNNDGEEQASDKKVVARKDKKVVDETLPQREQYGSVVDYLEAKYVRGVMLGDEIDEDEASDKESVYSEDSWLDDSMLKRDVAAQVLSHSTQTKVGVENDDDDDFFVNVGNLEVEEDELMNYDPADDEEKAVKKKTKKRKRSDAGSTKSAKSGKSLPKKKKIDSKSASSSTKNTKLDSPKKAMSVELAAQKEKVTELQAAVKELFDALVNEIKGMSKEDLPEKEKNVQVTVTVLEGKNPGDTITFGYGFFLLLVCSMNRRPSLTQTPYLCHNNSNPHVPGQRLKVSVPQGKKPGDTFKVSIPAPEVETETDGNKFTREFQELAAQYATKFDLMCQAEAEYHQADPEQKGKFPLKAKKIAKFDDLASEFPSNLLTPIDAAYMKKIVRRARQNKKKRKEYEEEVGSTVSVASKPDSKPAAKPSAAKPAAKTKPAMKLDVKSMPKAPKQKLLKAMKPAKKPEPEATPKTIEIILPSKGQAFPRQELLHDEFEGMTQGATS